MKSKSQQAAEAMDRGFLSYMWWQQKDMFKTFVKVVLTIVGAVWGWRHRGEIKDILSNFPQRIQAAVRAFKTPLP